MNNLKIGDVVKVIGNELDSPDFDRTVGSIGKVIDIGVLYKVELEDDTGISEILLRDKLIQAPEGKSFGVYWRREIVSVNRIEILGRRENDL